MDSYNQCAESTQKLLKLTQLLGWMINVEKSELNSTQIDIHNLLKDFALPEFGSQDSSVQSGQL